MGKKTKGNKRNKSRLNEDNEEDDWMENDLKDDTSQLDIMSMTDRVEKIGQEETQIDLFFEGLENLDNKKMQSRLNALNNILKSLQSGVDLFDRVSSNMNYLVGHLQRFISGRASITEAILAMQVISILALVAGAENDKFADDFTFSLIELATKSNIENVELRTTAVRTLAFIHFVCSDMRGGYSCLGVIGDIALQQSEGTDACPQLQVAAADAWCLLANTMDPQQVCDVSREEDMFAELVDLLGSSNTETKILAGQCLALLWEIADKIRPNVEATVSAELICDNDDKVHECLETLKQIGKESSKRVSKKDRKERKSALKSVTDWVLDGVVPEPNVVHLHGGEAELTTFGEIRVMDYLRNVLKGGLQSCMRIYPVTREMLSVDYISFDEQRADYINEAAGGGGITCEAFDKRFVRSHVGKVKSNHRRNQRADKELMQAEYF